ncbi:hypothetical protein D7W82_20655 [Corallococcus sp. CA049B]|uniref:hypothetical protein n=1 Tax=Corallococcus sp. CA049B TaxID=2316730 RepID=UPI000EA4076E|nr:hypothetical protein [Corallococcus sp. CA049B]RKG85074.1 hypothetical protein D7W82_20655 [Corallococcus sp. CA049B]
MKKQLFLGAMALGAVACTPEIAQEAPNLNVGLAEFDPSASPAVVPSPNDLAINQQTKKVNAPINPAASPAEQEFTRDYLNSLNGFPTSAIANTKIKDLDPSSVSPKTVIFIDMYQGTPLATKPVTPTLAYNEDTDLLNIIPPVDLNTGLPAWPKGSRYAVALVGGENGLKTTSGQPIIGSATWAFINSDKSLVTCEDLTSPDCGPATELIPSTETDPAKRLADQTAKSLQLEQLRLGYKQVFDKALAPQGFKREDIVLIWTFSILNQPEATINLAANDRLPLIVPFPNNLIRKPDGSGLDFPVPPTPGLQQDLFNGLNTLDGFSTTGAIVAENGDTTGVLDGTMYRVAADGPAPKLDPESLAAGVKFFKVTNQKEGTQPDVTTCLVNNSGDCGTSVSADDGVVAVPQQLQIIPKAPLDGATEYGAVLTTDLKDEKGRNVAPSTAFALLRLANPVYNETTKKSLISSVPDGLAEQLEPRRKLLKPYFDKVAAPVKDGGLGIPRSQIALGWNFTTQSTTSVLQQLYTLPGGVYGTPAAPTSIFPITSQVKAAMAGAGFASTNVGAVYEVRANTPWLLTGPFGTLNPGGKRDTRYPFMLFVPTGTAPTGGWPVAVFGHGLTSNRTAVLGVANKLNGAGYAVAAMDAVYHGERTSCVGAAAVLPTPNPAGDSAACADPATQRCEDNAASPSYGRCVARTVDARADCSAASLPAGVPADVYCSSIVSQGQCMADNKCEGGDFLRSAQGVPVISGWNFLNLGNLFTTRDNFRHHVVDFSQFLRVLASQELSDAVGGLNAAQVDYVGQSLGGIMGTMSTAVSPRVRRSVLNVAGGNLTGVLLTAPAFAAQRTAFLGSLAAAGIKPGMPAFDTFISLAGTILDPADARNYAYLLDNNPAAPTNAAEHRTFIQYIEGDQVIPNANTLALINAANRTDAPRTVASYMFPEAVIGAIPAAGRHAFLNNPQIPEAVRNAAQDQIIGFLATGTVAQ